ncbi:MAG: tRNA (guanosine(18)-2'-O)-methyltransferase TrmH [Deltaproteobacteria bacterium]|nr:tRNA (guanosine(18)-2'-O)-methyltransferase TrmH [Candidatus Anaeroferrophillacea bacterium]
MNLETRTAPRSQRRRKTGKHRHEQARTNHETDSRFQRLVTVLSRRQPDLTVLLDNVHKPHNLAAIARTCDAVGIGEIHAAVPGEPVRLTQRAAAGIRKWVATHIHDSIAAAAHALRDRGFRLLAAHLTADARDYRAVDLTRPTCLVFGAELEGLSVRAAATVDGFVTIPMLGHVQSLNVSVAAAVVLYEAQRQRQAAGFYDRRRLADGTFQKLLFEWYHPRIAAYCHRHGFPYPALNAAGDVVGDLPRSGRKHVPPAATGPYPAPGSTTPLD